MDTEKNITRRQAIVASALTVSATVLTPSAAQAEAPDRAAMRRIRELSREISHLLNSFPHPQSVTIEPSDIAVYPVLMMAMNPGVLPDHLAMMNRGLAVMERAAKSRDPSVLGLGLVWGIDDGRFNGVAVHYSRQAGA